MGKDRSKGGQFTPEHTDAEILAAVRAHEPAATSEVAGEVGMTRQGADRRLRRLRDGGRVNSKKIGASLVWFAPDDESGRGPAETPTAGQADRTDPPTTSPATRGQDAGEIDATGATGADPIGDALDGWEPDTDGNPRTARAQTRNAAEWLRSKGEYRRAGEFRDALAGDSTLSTRTWWEKHVRPGLNHLADRGLVEYTKNRGYRWVGDGEES